MLFYISAWELILTAAENIHESTDTRNCYILISSLFCILYFRAAAAVHRLLWVTITTPAPFCAASASSSSTAIKSPPFTLILTSLSGHTVSPMRYSFFTCSILHISISVYIPPHYCSLRLQRSAAASALHSENEAIVLPVATHCTLRSALYNIFCPP